MSETRPTGGVNRQLPQLTDLNRFYWTAGRDGRLLVQRCGACLRLIHPPAVLCPDDHSPELHPVAVSGRAKVETWTDNRKTWLPGFPAPYLLAYVVLEEDPRARILTNLVNADREEVDVGMKVRVLFERHVIDDDEIFVPLFEPDPDA